MNFLSGESDFLTAGSDFLGNERVVSSFCKFLVIYLLYRRLRAPSRRYWVHPMNLRRTAEGEFRNLFLPCLTSWQDQFFVYTRMEVQQFKELAQIVEPLLKKRSQRRPLQPTLRLALTLKFLAHGGSVQSIAWNYRVGTSTARCIIKETCTAIWTALSKDFVKIPSTPEEWASVAKHFWEQWNFPNCIGAIDGKHVAIRAPCRSGSQYYNYKGFNSIVLMAACDAFYKFTWVDVGSYGSKSDGGIFGESSFGKAVLSDTLHIPGGCLPGREEVVPLWFVADEAFPLKVNIMRPYPGHNLDEGRRIFNYRLSRARRTIENSFGILVARWQVLQGKITGEPQTAEKIVLAAIALHNFIMCTNSSQYCPDTFVDSETNGNVVHGEWRNLVQNCPHRGLGRLGSNNAARAVVALRDQLTEYFVSDGEVEWQYAVVNRGWAMDH